MKCDKLKDYSILDIEAIDDERYKKEKAPGKWVPESRVYLKTEVDTAIDELKREHHKERHEYIDMVAQLKAKLVEQESENRKLKRALWLARAYRGSDNSILLPSNFMRKVWGNVGRKCLTKADEYK